MFERIQKLLCIAVACLVCLCCNQTTSNSQIAVHVQALDGLKFSKVRFNVKPGATVSLTLENVSDMPHNLVITKTGTREKVVDAALKLEGRGPELNFIPEIDEVLWSIPVISPGQSRTVTFTAPSQTGIYPYVCTYPGHGFTMFGEMRVTMDEDTTQTAAKDSSKIIKTENPHPYPLTTPYLYHAFIDGASPGAIGVALPNEISYCWDAGTCSMRFAWKGGFLDMSDLFEGHFDASAKVLGDIFFTGQSLHPVTFGGNSNPKVKYKGYRLIERYPEFHYQIDGVDVYELNKPKADSLGLVRQFRIPNAKLTAWVHVNDDAMKYEFSAGSFNNGRLKLSPAEAKNFTITMTSYHIAYKHK